MFRRTTAVLAVLAAAILNGQSASALGTPPPPPTYSWVTTCATAAFTNVVPQGTSVRVEGWIRPCDYASAPWNARWSLAEYRTTIAYAYLERYPDAPGQFSRTLQILGARGDIGTFAYCIMSTPTARRACVGIGRTPDGQGVTVVPMATNDPRLDAVPLVIDDEDPEPTCATCI